MEHLWLRELQPVKALPPVKGIVWLRPLAPVKAIALG
jgi:hypothetical protein